MIQSRYPTLRSPVAGPLTAAISPKSPPDQANGNTKKGQSAISWRENRLICAAVVTKSLAVRINRCSRNAQSP